MTRIEKAEEMFGKGFNCSQAVLSVFAEDFGISEELALRIATQFGGGARKGEMCGAVSGALMVLGLKYGHGYCENMPEVKAKAYSIAEDYMNRFAKKNGSVVCRDLLGYDLTKAEDSAKIKELGLFKTTCPAMIRSAVEILEEILGE